MEAMQCPVCGQHSPPAWHGLSFHEPGGMTSSVPSGKSGETHLALDWMPCSNEECQEVIVRVHEDAAEYDGRAFVGRRRETWLARPRFASATRRLHALVPEPFRSDYGEAVALLEISPRMSAVLARRILGDLLEGYADKTQFNLAARIDSFVNDGGHPSSLTENLHHFREIADFGAHTQVDKVVGTEEDGQEVLILDVDREEAEWTLDMVDRLFDYFIVQPAKDEEIKKRMDEKIERAGRKPLRSAESGDVEE